MAETQKQVRVILWGVPRCVSTSFLKCLTFLEDSVCWHEPYLYANMVGTDGTNTPFTQKMMKEFMAKIAEQPGMAEMMANQSKTPTGDNIYEAAKYDFAWVRARLEEEHPGKKLIFNKDMVQGIDGHYDALPTGYRHTFLIRHPLKVFASFKKMMSAMPGEPKRLQELTPFMIAPGFFFKEMYDLVEYVKKEKLEPEPIIIDADDLLADTPKMMKAYCEALGIPYSDSLLTWPSGDDVMLSKWISPMELLKGGQMAHKSTFASTGFGKPSAMPDRASLPEDVLEAADASMEYYDKLYEQRFKC